MPIYVDAKFGPNGEPGENGANGINIDNTMDNAAGEPGGGGESADPQTAVIEDREEIISLGNTVFSYTALANGGNGGEAGNGGSGARGFEVVRTTTSPGLLTDEITTGAGGTGGAGGAGGSGGVATATIRNNTGISGTGADEFFLRAEASGGGAGAGGMGGFGGATEKAGSVSSTFTSPIEIVTHLTIYDSADPGSAGASGNGGAGALGRAEISSNILDSGGGGDTITLFAEASGGTGAVGADGRAGAAGPSPGDPSLGAAGGAAGSALAQITNNVINAGAGAGPTGAIITITANASGGHAGNGGRGGAAGLGMTVESTSTDGFGSYTERNNYGDGEHGGSGGQGGDADAVIAGNHIFGSGAGDFVKLNASANYGLGGEGGEGGTAGTTQTTIQEGNLLRITEVTAGTAGGAGLDGADGTANISISGNEIALGGGGDSLLFELSTNTGAFVTITGNIFDGGSGRDRLDLSFMEIAGAAALDLTAETLTFGSGSNTARDFEVVFGTRFGDTLAGAEADDELRGGLGNDLIEGRGGADVLIGDDGDDTLDGGNGNDQLFGGVGIDLLRGGEGNDLLDGGEDLYGDGGNDTLLGGGGGRVDGGEGIDTAEVSRSSVTIALQGDFSNPATITALDDGTIITGIERLRFFSGTGNDILTASGYETASGAGDGQLHNELGGGDGADILTASNAGAKISGNRGNDTLTGGSAADVLSGDEDDDVIRLGGSRAGPRDAAFGGAGNDTIRAGDGDGIIEASDAGAADVLGDDGNDLIDMSELGAGGVSDVRGGEGDDTITGSGGNDRLEGNGGDDEVHGGDGNDTINGGPGLDELYGDGGNDTFQSEASAGAHRIDGGAGSDAATINRSSSSLQFLADFSDPAAEVELADGSRVTGVEQIVFIAGSGNDQITTTSYETAPGLRDGAAYNRVSGGAGNDVLRSGGTGATLDGGTGADLLVGGQGGDTLFGGNDNDVLNGGLGADTLNGGDGNDVLHSNSGADDGGDQLDGGGGTDSAIVGRQYATTAFALDLSRAASVLALGDGSTLISIEQVTFLSGTGDDTLTASAFESSAGAGDGANYNRIYGGGGNDTLTASSRGAELEGETGDDTLNGGVASDRLYGGRGNDVIYDGDTETSSAADVLQGGNDYDVIFSRLGGDEIDGGSEDDTLVIDLAFLTSGKTLTLAQAAQTGETIVAGDGTRYRNIELVEISLGSGDDIVNIDTGNTYVYAGSGNDDINAGNGNDLIYGQEGSDTISGGAGNDSLSGNDGDNTLDGEDGFDTALYFGGPGGVYVDLTAGRGYWSVGGNGFASGFDANLVAGVDVLISIEAVHGTVWDDYFIGSAANELFAPELGTDFGDGGDGFDILDVQNAGGAVFADFTIGRLVSGDSLKTFVNFEQIISGDFDDSLTGDENGNGFIAGEGNDTITGGLGNDTLTGGSGGDTFVRDANDASGAQSDVVTDFSVAEDRIDLGTLGPASFEAARNWLIRSTAADTTSLGDTRLLSAWNSNLQAMALTGVAAQWVNGQLVSTLSASNFVFDTSTTARTTAGTTGNDALFGGLGNDTLTGGSGADLMVGDAGNDSLTGNAGTDLFDGGAGADAFDGGADSDAVYYTTDGGVTLILGAPVAGVTSAIAGSSADALGDTFASIERIRGTAFADTITLNAVETTITGLSGYFGNDTLTGSAGANTISGGDGNDTLLSGGGNDTLLGEAGNDTLTANGVYTSATLLGGTGNDTLNGGNGIDVLQGQDGDDVINAGPGNDAAWGGANNDSITFTGSYTTGTAFGEAGEDTLTGGNGNDRLDGGADNDTLDGNDGNDILFGQSGADVVNGGGGNDLMYDADGMSGDAYTGGSGTDFLFYQTGGTFDFTAVGADSYDTSIEWVRFMAGAVTVTGTANADRFSGSTSGDTILAGGDNDWLQGLGGGDVLHGDGGNDRIEGGVGSDTIRGGTGTDQLTGGNTGSTAGDGAADTFLYTVADLGGVDRINDFEAGLDKIGLDAASFGFAAGPLAANRFMSLAAYSGGAANAISGDVFAYNAANGYLYWDADGATPGGLTVMAIFSNTANLTAGDFAFI